MKQLMFGLLLLPPFFAQALPQMPRTRLSDLQVSFNQLIKKSAQKNEKKLCGILQEISDNPISTKSEVAEWLSLAYERLDIALERPSGCSRTVTPLPAQIPVPSAPGITAPSAPEIKPSSAPSAPMPSVPEISKPTRPTMPSAPSSVPESIIKEPAIAAREQEIQQNKAATIPVLFDQINTIITRNKFQPRQTWPAQDQQELDKLIAQTSYDKNFSGLLRVYLQEYPTVQKPAQFVLQTAQAVNFLYAKPLNNTEIKKAISLLEKKGGHNTAKVLTEWPGVIVPLAQEQREQRDKEIKDILDVKKLLVAEPYEVWIDKIKNERSPEKKKELEELNNIRESFILEVGHEKEPDSYKAMIRRIKEIPFIYAHQEAEQLKQEIENELYQAQQISDQEAIKRLFDYIVDAQDRAAGKTLERILENALSNKEEEKEQLKTLINSSKNEGSTKGFMVLKKFTKYPQDEIEPGEFPAYKELAINNLIKKIK